jgi:PHP family Zn ribbon phosphoesterase
MDVFACLSCGRRFAVHDPGALGRWRCTDCNGEVGAVSRITAPAPIRSGDDGFTPSPHRGYPAEDEIHSASDVDAEIAALASLAREAERL